MQAINEIIKCIECKKTLEKPVILPCGKNICRKHFDEKQNHGQAMIFCLHCQREHIISSSDLIENSSLQDLINTKIDNFDLGETYSKALESCKELKNKLQDLESVQRLSDVYIQDFVINLINQIDLKREELKLKIDTRAEFLVQDLKQFEKDCLDKLIITRSSLESKLQNSNRDLENLSNSLKVFTNNNKEYEKINTSCVNKIDEVKNLMKEFKNEILLDRGHEFESKNSIFMRVFFLIKCI